MKKIVQLSCSNPADQVYIQKASSKPRGHPEKIVVNKIIQGELEKLGTHSDSTIFNWMKLINFKLKIQFHKNEDGTWPKPGVLTLTIAGYTPQEIVYNNSPVKISFEWLNKNF